MKRKLARTLRRTLAIAVELATYGIAGAIGWTVFASAWVLWRAELLRSSIPPLEKAFAWWSYVRHFGTDFDECLWILEGAVLATLPFAGLAKYHWRRLGGLIGISRRTLGIDQIRRSSTNNHGQADFLTDEQLAGVFPTSPPDPELGAIVVGELGRLDLSEVAGTDFKPQDPRTWGPGGKAPLLYDDFSRGSGHSMVIAPSGIGKTAVGTTSHVTYRGPRVAVDPDAEIGPQVREELEAQGVKVVELRLGSGGFNVLRAIDIEDDSAEGLARAQTAVSAVVSRIYGPLPSKDNGGGNNAIFEEWGRTIATCLLADIVWDTSLPPEDRTLEYFRQTITQPSPVLKDILREIAESSPSIMAQEMAASVMDLPDETWGGAYGNATQGCVWLSNEGFAGLVSGDDFEPAEITRERVAVFLQMPLDVMRGTPAVTRCVIGSLLDAVIRVQGAVAHDVWFPIDESELMGPEESLRTILNQGRKYGARLQLFYQSEAQGRRIWGNDGWNEIVDAMTWVQYGGISNLDTAGNLSKGLGTYGAIAESRGLNTGRQGKMLEMPSSSSGSNVNETEFARELLKAQEITQSMRTDERITVIKGKRPARHGAALCYRRPGIMRLLNENKFRANRTTAKKAPVPAAP